jgi:uncharacterized membrane protein affecting hemolysin expression
MSALDLRERSGIASCGDPPGSFNIKPITSAIAIVGYVRLTSDRASPEQRSKSAGLRLLDIDMSV